LTYQYTVQLGGVPLSLRTRHSIGSLGAFRSEETPVAALCVPEERYQTGLMMQRDLVPASVEFGLLSAEVGTALLPYDRCLFHGAAFQWRGKAWIVTAPPGTGKTTQYALWKMRYGAEIRLLNGDKPILEFRPDGEILVRPSPWCGKESMHTSDSAPLGGLIVLTRGSENRMVKLNAGAAVEPVYRQFIYAPDEEQSAAAVCRLEERMLLSIPVWELGNVGNVASAELAHDTITEWEAGKV